jgi:hypothetical protein
MLAAHNWTACQLLWFRFQNDTIEHLLSKHIEYTSILLVDYFPKLAATTIYYYILHITRVVLCICGVVTLKKKG